MHKQQINIIFNETNDSVKKGDFFEELVAIVFERQRYGITQRVNFTGMEIDLIATHKDRVNERVYIECKARNTLSATDIKSFVFNAQFKQVPYGYFLSVCDYVHQVAGLIEEMSQKDEYINLFFWGPSKIFELLEEADKIKKVHLINTKLILKKKFWCTLILECFGFFLLIMQLNPKNLLHLTQKQISL